MMTKKDDNDGRGVLFLYSGCWHGTAVRAARGSGANQRSGIGNKTRFQFWSKTPPKAAASRSPTGLGQHGLPSN